MPEPERSRTLLVLPNDPLERYEQKGEVKPRYLNPGDYFDKVHVFSLADRDTGIQAARVMAGRAEVHVHAVGRPGPLNWRSLSGRMFELAWGIKPDVVRGYNPLLMGWLAVRLAGHCGAMSVVSVHADYHLWRNIRIHGPSFLLSPRGAYQAVHSALGMYRTSIGKADHVICAYNFPAAFVRNWRSDGVSVIYNRVDLASFQPGERQTSPRTGPVKIITVGRQFEGKDPEPLLRALAGMEGAELTLVGDGPLHGRLRKLAADLGIAQRTEFIPRVDHAQLPRLYRGHDLFAINITHPGVCIPVLEAAATGLPVVINRPLWEDQPEVVGNLAEVVEPTADGYGEAFRRLRDTPDLRLRRGGELRRRVAEMGGDEMERREAGVYRDLCEQLDAEKGKESD